MKKTINHKIAEALGFKYYETKNGDHYWQYPPAYIEYQYSNPSSSIPDFESLIKTMLELHHKTLPREFIKAGK